MNKYDNLPLYRQCITLVVKIEKAMAKTTRQYRFTMGERMVGMALKLPLDFHDIWTASQTAEKLNHCNRFIRHLVQLKTLLDVSHELGLFYHADFPEILESVDSIERQINGMLNKNTKVQDTTCVK